MNHLFTTIFGLRSPAKKQTNNFAQAIYFFYVFRKHRSQLWELPVTPGHKIHTIVIVDQKIHNVYQRANDIRIYMITYTYIILW